MNIHSGWTSDPFTFYVYTTIYTVAPDSHAYRDKVPKHANLNIQLSTQQLIVKSRRLTI